MRNLLQDADRDRLVAPLAGSLLRGLDLDGARRRALAEGEASHVLDAEANARAAEFLMLPGIREAQGELGDDILDFAMAMAEAKVPARRAMASSLAVLRDDPRDVEIVTPWWRLTGDLSRGELRQELREGGVAVRHTGNMVEFRAGRFFTCADVEDAIVAQSVERLKDGRVRLSHTSAIRGQAGWFYGAVAEVGRLTMTYEVTPGSPILRVTASFTATRGLDRLRVTTAADALDEHGLGAGAAKLLDGAAWQDVAIPAAGSAKWAEGEKPAQIAIGEAGWPAGAPVLQIRLHEPSQLMSITADTRRPGALHWLVLRHGFRRLGRGETLTIVEDRLLGPEAEPEALAGGMQGTPDAAAAPSGAVLLAAATALQFDAAGAWRERLPEARRSALAAFAQRHLARIEAGEPDGLDLACAALAADALRRAGLMADAQPRLVERLAARLRDGVLGGPGAGLAAQGAAALAFARAAALSDAAAADLATGALTATLGAVSPQGVGLVLGGAPVEAAAEAEGIALLARAAGAAVLAAEAGAPVPPATVERAKQLHRIGVNLLRPLVQPRGPILAVVGPGGMTPGLQALVAMAMIAPDRLVLARSSAAA
jgi:hypothetical protein